MIHLTTLLALGFAAYRATQFVVHDSLLDGARQRLEAWRVARFQSRFRAFVWDLVGCIYCIGFWLSALTVAVYLTATGTWSWTAPVEVWAVAGVQALLNRWDDSRPVGGA